MKFLYPVLTATAVFIVACAEHPAEPSRGPIAPSAARGNLASAGDDSQFVLTPAGRMPKACVHELPSGAWLDQNDIVHSVSGENYHLVRCAAKGAVLPSAAGGGVHGSTPPTVGPWEEWTEDIANAVIRNLSVNWNVPSAPAGSYSGGGSYYAFPGITSNASDPYILQPVLTYNSSGWSIASWRCDGAQTDCVHSTSVAVSAGHAIHGSVVASGCSGNTCTYTITTQDVTSSQSTSMSWTSSQSFIYVEGGAVEAYNASGTMQTICDRYPTTGVFFTSISVTDANGTFVPNWSAYTNSSAPSCMFYPDKTSTTTSLYHNPIVTIGGTLVGEVPTVTWSAVPGATSYTMYRQWQDNLNQTGSSGFETMGAVTSGWTDPNLCSDAYTGATTPGFSTRGYIKYQLIANGGGSYASNVINFRLADCI